MIAWLWIPTVLAAPPDLPDEGDDIDISSGPVKTGEGDDWGFEAGDDLDLDMSEEDAEMVDFAAAQKRLPPPPTHFHLDAKGKQPLGDDWPLHFVAYDDVWIVVELPVLVAQGRAAFATAHPEGLVVVGEWTSAGQRITVKHEVKAEQVLESGPTWVFLKAALPNPARSSEVEVIVKTGEGAESPKQRYTRTGPIARK